MPHTITAFTDDPSTMNEGQDAAINQGTPQQGHVHDSMVIDDNEAADLRLAQGRRSKPATDLRH